MGRLTRCIGERQTPSVTSHEAVVLGDSVLLPSRIRLDKSSVTPLSLTKSFWREWATMPSREEAIAAAVDSLRRQSRTSAE